MIRVASTDTEHSYVTLEDFVSMYLVLDMDISKEMNLCILSDINITVVVLFKNIKLMFVK